MNSPVISISSHAQDPSPKYCKVIDSVLSEIHRNVFRPGDRIPSIKEASEEYLLSRDTVEKAYRELSQRGVLISVPGKGYYVKGKTASSKLKVLTLLPTLGPEELDLYDAFVQGLGKQGVSHLYCYHFQEQEFTTILNNYLGDYDYYLVLPRFQGSSEQASQVLKKIPQNKLILLGKKPSRFPSKDPELARMLSKLLLPVERQLSKYDTWTFLKPSSPCCVPVDWDHALIQYGQSSRAKVRTACMSEGFEPTAGQVYFVWSDKDLDALLCTAQQMGWKLGQDIGVISFHEHVLKTVLAGGITTIQIDAEEMGFSAAEMVIHNLPKNFKLRLTLNQRASL